MMSSLIETLGTKQGPQGGRLLPNLVPVLEQNKKMRKGTFAELGIV